MTQNKIECTALLIYVGSDCIIMVLVKVAERHGFRISHDANIVHKDVIKCEIKFGYSDKIN